MSLRNLFGRGRDAGGDDDEADEDVAPYDVEAEDDVVDEVDEAEAGDVDDAEPEGAGEVDETDDADDAEDAAGERDDEVEDTGYVEFELVEFGGRERQMLDAELDAARVRRAWEASTLVVAARDAEVVDDLIDLIEERIALDLPPDVEPVVYGVGDWPVGLEDRFLEALIENRIAHLRGYREITVGVDDEERVDELVEEVTSAWEDEQVPDDELDEPDAQDVLSELFVTADRLLHGPSDKGAVVRFDDAATTVEGMRVPFGFDEATWTGITTQVTALHDLLGEAESSDEEIVEAATDLRTLLRPLV